MLRITFLAICCIALAIHDTNAESNLAKQETRILDRLINTSSIQKHLLPRNDEGTLNPLEVTLNMYVRHIEKIDPENGVWKVQLTFREEWLDPRLSFSYYSTELKHLTLTTPNLIWTPDIFFPHELEGKIHSVPQPQILIRILPDGHVLQSRRITLLLACPALSGHKDTVVCPLRIASYAYTSEDIVLKWKEDPIVVSKKDDLYIDNNSPFLLREYNATSASDSVTNTGSYGNVIATFTFAKPSNKCHS